MSVKLKTINIFDLIQNSKTIYSTLNKNRSFNEYVNEASRIYFNLKRGGLSNSEFSQKTGIPKSTLSFLGAMKKLDGDYWPELHLKINELNGFIEQNVKELNNCISLLENCPIQGGFRKYNNEILKIIFGNINSNYPLDYLNIIGFDIGQYEKCKELTKTTKLVEKDIKKSKKIKQEKIIKSFKDHPIIIDVKLISSNWKNDIKQKLHIVDRYRELSAIENGYTFKQFCNDCNLNDKFKSLNYYYLNYEKSKEKSNKDSKNFKDPIQNLDVLDHIKNEQEVEKFLVEKLENEYSDREIIISELETKINTQFQQINEHINKNLILELEIVSLNTKISEQNEEIKKLKDSIFHYKEKNYKLIDHLVKIKTLAYIVDGFG